MKLTNAEIRNIYLPNDTKLSQENLNLDEILLNQITHEKKIEKYQKLSSNERLQKQVKQQKPPHVG
jgi:hypothetical protein